MGNSPQTVIAEIASDINASGQDITLYEEINFNARANAIDYLDFHIIDRVDNLPQTAQLAELKQRAEKLKRKLEKIDSALFKKLRENIMAGFYTGPAFRKMVGEYTVADVSIVAEPGKMGYDNLDIFINGILCDQPVPDTIGAPQPEMVVYQQTPARIIFQLAQMAQLGADDLFFDIGSGLGHVPILINLLSGAKTQGIEYEQAYCSFAKNNALNLHLSDVQFINADAREGNYSKGTVFFLYTPFQGSMLQEMLNILKDISLKRAIRIFTYGPCSIQLVQQKWLACLNGKGNDFYKLYEFISLAN